jgi:hypothetical protein
VKSSHPTPFAILALTLSALACAAPGAITSTAPPITQIIVEPYASPTLDPAFAAMATSTLPPTATPVTARPLEDDVNLRAGPGLDQALVGTLKSGESVQVIGRSDDVPWFQVACSCAPDGLAWVFGEVVVISGDISTLPEVTIKLSGTAVVLPTLAPTDPPAPSAPGVTPTPYGCQKPPDDYTRVTVSDGIVINQRTWSMLAHAQELYGGKHEFLKAITQGSYNVGVEASFGTHDGGGAVDLSVRDFSTYAVLTGELPVIILALREAGFAAWVREEGELGAGSSIHIHAIAVGDRDLSPAARRQIDGVEGYFRGFNGLPVDPPARDKWGAPILCPWMVEMGFTDMR